MSITLTDRLSIKFKDVALILNYKSKLIFLAQLQKNKITYHNTNLSMLLMQDDLPIAYAKRDQKLVILNFLTPKKIMQTIITITIANILCIKLLYTMMTIGRGRPTSFISSSIKM